MEHSRSRTWGSKTETKRRPRPADYNPNTTFSTPDTTPQADEVIIRSPKILIDGRYVEIPPTSDPREIFGTDPEFTPAGFFTLSEKNRRAIGGAGVTLASEWAPARHRDDYPTHEPDLDSLATGNM